MIKEQLLKNISLREKEKIHRIIRRSLWSYSRLIFYAVFLIILAFFLIYPLFQYGWWGIIIFILLLVFGLWLGFKVIWLYFFNIWILSSRRVIDFDQQGFFGRTISSASYSKIADVSWEKKGILKTIFGLGNITIDLFGTFDPESGKRRRVKLKIINVKKPADIAAEIIFLQEVFLRRKKSILHRQSLLKK